MSAWFSGAQLRLTFSSSVRYELIEKKCHNALGSRKDSFFAFPDRATLRVKNCKREVIEFITNDFSCDYSFLGHIIFNTDIPWPICERTPFTFSIKSLRSTDTSAHVPFRPSELSYLIYTLRHEANRSDISAYAERVFQRNSRINC